MQEVPKIVRSRLRPVAPPTGHPDPDVLTAFAEDSLPRLERSVVLEHLGRCGDCREMLALALPPVEEAALQKTAARRTWFAMPALRWGTALAGVVILGAIGFVHYGGRGAVQMSRSANESHLAANYQESAPPPPAEAPIPQPQAAPAASRKATFAHKENLAAAPKTSPAAPNSAVGLTIGAPLARSTSRGFGAGIGAGSSFGGTFRGGNTGANANSFHGAASARASNLAGAAAKQAPPSNGLMIDTQAVEVQAATPLSTDQPDQSKTLGRTISNESEAKLVARNDDKVWKAKPAVPAQSSVPAPPAPAAPRPLQTSPALLDKYQAPLPTWTITQTGGLQRSFDSGKTWNDVNVFAAPAAPESSANSAAYEIAANAPTKKVERQKLSKAPAVVFRAVAAIGPEVWAGGSSGALYHSGDAGQHWIQVLPSSEGVALTGDVIALAFSDAQHGTVTSSTSEIWITANGGQSWQKAQ